MNTEKITLFPSIMIGCKMQIKWNSKISGIYAWVNEVNGKMYVGRSVNLYKRVYDEMNGFQNYKKQNMKKLFNAIKKYGISNFRVIRLLECPPEYLNKLEMLLIDYYDTKNNGYNCTVGGDGTNGYKVSKKQIEKQRISLKKYWSDKRKSEHSQKLKKWANDKIRKNHLIDKGTQWQYDLTLVEKQRINYKKTLTPEEIERRRQSLIHHYKLNNGRAIRYKEITLYSPSQEITKITNIKHFCKENGLGRVGFYEFLRRNDYENSFRGWKVISKTT